MLERHNGRKEQVPFHAFANLFSTYSRLKHESKLSLTEFLQRYSWSIRQGFAEPIENGAIPILICAWNEIESLPRLLRALSLSTVPVKPIVVDNNSTDGTGELASSLGAIVITEKQQGLMRALIAGFKYLAGNHAVKEFLLTDADTYPTPTWAEGMKKAGVKISDLSGGLLGGRVIYYGKLMRDTARNISVGLGDLASFASKITPVRGPNGYIKFGTDGVIAHHLSSDLDPNMVMHSDVYIGDSVKSVGGTVKMNFSPDAWVFSSGDRFPTFLSLFKAPPYGDSLQDLYLDWIRSNPDGKIYKSNVVWRKRNNLNHED